MIDFKSTKKLLFLSCFAVVVSCNKKDSTASPYKNKDLEITDSRSNAVSKIKIIYADTIQIDNSKEKVILTHLVRKIVDKNGIVTATYRLDFYSNKIKIASSEISINNYEKGSEWSASYGLTSTTSKNSNFIQIDFGYPACGYSHSNYLYYLNGNTIELIHQWQTMTDSGWGSWVEFLNPSGKENPALFYCKNISYEPTDDNEDLGVLSYSDSTVFRLKGAYWQKELLSTKNKPYFEKKISFDEFHNQK